jgi:septal ring factor EnvC (AmiA/AmiB activator)
MKSVHLLVIAFFCTSLSFSQNTENEEQDQQPSAVENLETVVDKSNNYQQYKVVEKVEINTAIDNVSDAFDSLSFEISSLKDSIQSQDKQIQSLNTEVSVLNKELSGLQNEKDEILFLEMPFTKSNYKTMTWSIMSVFIILLFLFIFKYNRSNLLTKEAKQNLKNLDADHENYKRISLEKQQKLGRELQDERNKVQKLSKGNQK